MNNEPVAWIIDVKMTDCDDNFIWNTGNYPDWQVKDWIPLYTHPVKELTDEDIDIALYVADITLDNLSDGDISMERIKAFVRTILRKARE